MPSSVNLVGVMNTRPLVILPLWEEIVSFIKYDSKAKSWAVGWSLVMASWSRLNGFSLVAYCFQSYANSEKHIVLKILNIS